MTDQTEVQEVDLTSKVLERQSGETVSKDLGGEQVQPQPEPDKGTPEPDQQKQEPTTDQLLEERKQQGRALQKLGNEKKQVETLASAALSALNDLPTDTLQKVLDEDPELASAFEKQFPDRFEEVEEETSEETQEVVEEKSTKPEVDMESLADQATARALASIYKKQQEEQRLDLAKKFAASHSLNEDEVDSLYKGATALADTGIDFEKALFGVYATKHGDDPAAPPTLRSASAPSDKAEPQIDESRVNALMSSKGYSREKAEKIVKISSSGLQNQRWNGNSYEIDLSELM